MLIQIVHITLDQADIPVVTAATIEKVKASNMEQGVVWFALFKHPQHPSQLLIQEIYHNELAVYLHKKTKHYLKWREIVDQTSAKDRIKNVLSNAEQLIPLKD